MLKLDVRRLLPKYNTSGVKVNVEVNKEIAIIYWVNRNRGGKVLNPSQPKPLTLPRHTTVDEKFGEAIGLYFGDGAKNDFSCVEFANSCPTLVLLWINHLSHFNVTRNDFMYKVKVSENARVKYNVEEVQIKEYWRESIDIPPKKEIKVIWVKTKGKPSNYLKKFGTLVVTYHNVVFSLFYNTLIKNVPLFLKISKSFRTGFMRGLIAADGNINLKKNGSLSLVRIAGNKAERAFIQEILDTYFDIKSREGKNNQLYFGGSNDFKKLKMLNLYSLHPDKKKRFENRYKTLLRNLNRKSDKNAVLKNKTAIKVLRLLLSKPLTYKEILKNVNIKFDQLSNLFNGYKCGKYEYNGLEKLGLVSNLKNQNNKSEKIWFLTKKGKIFLRNLAQK